MTVDIQAHACDRRYTTVFTQRVASQVELKDQLIADIISEMEQRQWVGEDDRHWLLLSLDEAIVNAMIHGNEGDPSLFIDVELASMTSSLSTSTDDNKNNKNRKKTDHKNKKFSWVIVVKDQGDGFSPDDVPDSDNPDSLLLEHGRGILLMGEWLDELIYYDGGSTIFMSKACSVPDAIDND